MLGNVGIFENPVSLFKARIEIAPGFFDRRAERAGADREIAVQRNLRRVGFQRFVGIEHVWNFFIFNFD